MGRPIFAPLFGPIFRFSHLQTARAFFRGIDFRTLNGASLKLGAETSTRALCVFVFCFVSYGKGGPFFGVMIFNA